MAQTEEWNGSLIRERGHVRENILEWNEETNVL